MGEYIYHKKNVLGVGAIGTVYKAHGASSEKSDEVYALKKINKFKV